MDRVDSGGTSAGPAGSLLRSVGRFGRTLGARIEARWGPEALPIATVLAAIAGLAVWWASFDLARLATFHLSVYDLGVNYQAIWAAAHGHRIDASGPLDSVLVVYLYIPAYYLFPNVNQFLQFLLVFEVVWVFLGAVPLYLVARDRLASRGAAVAVALAYLIYPALNGPLWFPVHMEAIFPTLFLFGYWRFRAADYRSAAGIFALSLFTNVGAPIVLAAFAVGMLVEPRLPGFFAWIRHALEGEYVVPRFRAWWRPWTPKETLAAFLLVAAAGVLLALFAWYGVWSILYFIGQSSFSSGTGLARAFPIDPFAAFPQKLTTLFVVFGPLLALPLLAREERWALLPLLAAGVLTPAHPQFLFPFRDQYSVWIFPFALAAAVRGLERLEVRRKRLVAASLVAATRPGRFRRWRHRWTPRRGAVAAGLAVLLFSAFLAPWSPANRLFQGNPTVGSYYYQVGASTSGNASVDRHLAELESLLPTPAIVLLQNNLPATMGRTNFYVPGYYYLGDPLDYLINDPYNTQFDPGQNFGPEPHSMLFWSNFFLNQSNWGVAGEADGALVLAHDFVGPPKVYEPLHERLTPANFPSNESFARGANASTGPVVLDAGPRLPLDQQYSVYSPGSFTFTVTLTVTHPAPFDELVIELAGLYGAQPLFEKGYSGSMWSGVSGEVSITIPITFSQYYLGMHFSIVLPYWDGPITFDSLAIDQTAPAIV